MKLQVTIPQLTVTLESKDGTLPEGTMIQLSVPLTGLVTKPVEAPVIPVVEPTPVEVPVVVPEQVSPVEEAEPENSVHVPRFERTYEPVEFRAKRFDTLGKAPALGLNDSNWTIVLNVRFTTFDQQIRVIGSATASAAGSSLQIGVLKGGILWVDTFLGALTAGHLVLNRWYEIAVSHNRAGEEKIYLDRKLISAVGNIPVFKSQDDVYVGRWVDYYADFDLKRVRIYPLLSDEEVKSL